MPLAALLEYDLSPRSVQPGTRWVTLTIMNHGEEDLSNLDVRLNSVDTYSLTVQSSGSFVASLRGGESAALHFQIQANSTARLYATVDGEDPHGPFHHESPGMLIVVGKEIAELLHMFVMAPPYPPVGEPLEIEATVRGLAPASELAVEFWGEPPGGRAENIATTDNQTLEPGQEARFIAAITPTKEGLYAIYAYLFHGIKRIGRDVVYFYARAPEGQ